MLWILSRWKVLSAATAAIALVGYIGLLNVQLATERATVAMLDADLRTEQAKVEICAGNLSAAIKDKLTDEAANSLSASELIHALNGWVSDNPGGD